MIIEILSALSFAGRMQGAVVVAPKTVEVPGTVACGRCEIQVSRVATLRGSGDVDLDPSPAVIKDSRGRYYSWNRERTQVVVFDTAGLVVRTIGRKGQGPGEFYGSVSGELRIGPGDSLFVFNYRSVSIWDSTGRLGRTVPLPTFIYNARLFGDGRILLNASLRTPDGAGLPFHRMSKAGEVLSSFGSESGELRPECFACQIRVVAKAADSSSVWAALPDQYVIERWAIDGRAVARLSMQQSSWFPAFTSAQRAGMRVRLSPITSLRADPDGLLWIRANIPGAPLPAAPTRGVQRVIRRDPIGSIIDVVDTRTGRLVASQRFDKLLILVADGDLAFSPQEGPDGLVTIDVLRLRLKYPN